MPDVNERRLRRVTISPEMFIELLRTRAFEDVLNQELIEIDGLPQTAKAYSFAFDSQGCVVLLASDESWPEVPTDEMIPPQPIEFKVTKYKIGAVAQERS